MAEIRSCLRKLKIAALAVLQLSEEVENRSTGVDLNRLQAAWCASNASLH